MSPKAKTPDYDTLVAEPKLPLADRPAEVGAFFLIAPPLYGWLVEVHVPNLLAALLAFAVGVAPLVISWLRDGKGELDDPGDHDSETGPEVKKGKNEAKGIDHDALPTG